MKLLKGGSKLGTSTRGATYPNALGKNSLWILKQEEKYYLPTYTVHSCLGVKGQHSSFGGGLLLHRRLQGMVFPLVK